MPKKRSKKATPPKQARRRPTRPKAEHLESEPLPLPEPDEAVTILREVLVLNARAVTCQAIYAQARADAKDAKDAWEAAVTAVQDRLRVVTDPAPLPLFDAAEREADQARMEAAAVPLDPEVSPEPEESADEFAF